MSNNPNESRESSRIPREVLTPRDAWKKLTRLSAFSTGLVATLRHSEWDTDIRVNSIKQFSGKILDDLPSHIEILDIGDIVRTTPPGILAVKRQQEQMIPIPEELRTTWGLTQYDWYFQKLFQQVMHRSVSREEWPIGIIVQSLKQK